MVSAVVSTPSGHRHTAWPSLNSTWCAQCSAMTDFCIVLSDHLLEKE
jgi:hypothetical protein